jgi:hypothetical protein
MLKDAPESGDESEIDSLLAMWATFAEWGTSAALTVQVAGLLVSGNTMGTADWLRAWVADFRQGLLSGGATKERADEMAARFRVNLDVTEAVLRAEGDNLPSEAHGQPRFLNLKDVQVFHGLPSPPYELGLWRIRLDRIDAWRFGRLRQG